jgi:hypothetical protein
MKPEDPFYYVDKGQQIYYTAAWYNFSSPRYGSVDCSIYVVCQKQEYLHNKLYSESDGPEMGHARWN